MATRTLLIILCWMVGSGWFCGWAEGQGPQPPSPGSQKAVKGRKAPPPTVVIVYNRPIVNFRAKLLASSPQERARQAEERIQALIASGRIGTVSTRSITEGINFLIDNRAVFILSPEDLDPDAGESMEQASQQVVKNLTLALNEVREARSLSVLLWAGGYTLLALVALLVFFWALLRGHRWLASRLEAFERRHLQGIRLEGLSIVEIDQIILLTRFLGRIVVWSLALIASYAWLSNSLERFPYTRAWGEGLGDLLIETVKEMILSIVDALPGIFMVVVILFITRFLTRMIKASFSPVEKGQVKTRWLDMDTAIPTRRILVVFIWLFALVMMYPYIPGSDSDAFKGIGIFVGLMASLGSTALVGQAASGLVLTYSRAFRPGDYVRIGETEGTVIQLGLLSTKIRTNKREEVTIPNAGLIGTNIKNYSRQAGPEGVILHTTVTIGYSTPWRQVHEMLLVAADRTPGLKKEPKPFVFQTALSDFYVEYQLNAYLERPESRVSTLAALHPNIQDSFNEHGVQIMSPHYEADPAEKVWVPREKWFEAPAKPADISKADGGQRAIPGQEKPKGQ